VEVCGSLWKFVFKIKKRGPYETDQMHACPTQRKIACNMNMGDPFSMNTDLMLLCHKQTTEQWSILCRGNRMQSDYVVKEFLRLKKEYGKK
jgi:hypothetical protein